MNKKDIIKKKYHRRIIKSTRCLRITLSPAFLEERNLKAGDVLDIRTMKKIIENSNSNKNGDEWHELD